MRYDRIDNFWFVLRHELEHVIHEHGKSLITIDAELEGDRAGTGDNVADEERIANMAAAEFCVPRKTMDNFIAAKRPALPSETFLGWPQRYEFIQGWLLDSCATGLVDMIYLHAI